MLEAFPAAALELAALEPHLVKLLETQNLNTNNILQYVFSSGGKRIRPAIFLLCSHLLGYSGEFKKEIASVCEFIHTASLLHDDVIDNSDLRRGKLTVNALHGNKTAILSGDLIYSTACCITVQTKNIALIDSIADCIRTMSESELFQLDILWKLETSLDDYLKVVYGKTAALFATSAKAPGLLLNLNSDILANLENYGKYLGFAFQIIDDLLDYSGDEKTVGKELVKDIAEGKVTLPLILGMQKSNIHAINLKEFIQNICHKKNITTQEKEELVVLVKETEGLVAAKLMAENYISKAIKSIQNIIQITQNNNEEVRDSSASLIKLANFVLERKS